MYTRRISYSNSGSIVRKLVQLRRITNLLSSLSLTINRKFFSTTTWKLSQSYLVLAKSLGNFAWIRKKNYFKIKWFRRRMNFFFFLKAFYILKSLLLLLRWSELWNVVSIKLQNKILKYSHLYKWLTNIRRSTQFPRRSLSVSHVWSFSLFITNVNTYPGKTALNNKLLNLDRKNQLPRCFIQPLL